MILAPRKITYDQLDEISQMFQTFTAGLQAALQTSVENALITALQNQLNRSEEQSQQAIFMERDSEDDDLCGEYREIIGDPVFDVYDDDNQIQDLNDEFDAHKTEYLVLTPKEHVNIFTSINNEDDASYMGHEKQYINNASWKEDWMGVFAYHDMVGHVSKKAQGSFNYLANHPQYIQKEPPDCVQRSEECHYKEICAEKIFDSGPIGCVYVILFLGTSCATFADTGCRCGQNQLFKPILMLVLRLGRHDHILDFVFGYTTLIWTSEEHRDYKFDGDPAFGLNDENQIKDVYTDGLWANSYEVDPYIPCKFVKRHFVIKKPVLISELMQGLMVTFSVALMTYLLGISKRLKLILNGASKSLSFGHSRLEEEETISLVLSCYLVYFPSFEKEDTFNTIHEQLLSSLNRGVYESGLNNLVIFCSCYALSHDFHCTSMALVLETRVTLVFFNGAILAHISLPGLLDIKIILGVTERIHEVVSFRERHALFLPWFSGKLVMTGFGVVLFSELMRISRISHHHRIFDLLIDQKSFVDREKYKIDIKWELLILCVVTDIDILIDNVNYSTGIATSSSCRVAKIDCFLVDVLDGKEEYKLFWPPGTLTVRMLLPFPLMISHVVFRICLVSVPFIINTKVMQFAKALVDYKAFDTFEHLRPLAILFIRSKALWPFSPTFTTESLVSVHAFSLQVGVCYEVLKSGIKVVLCSNYTSTTPIERTDVACDSSKWVICLIFHHVLRFMRGAVVFGSQSPSCIQCSLLLWEILKDANEFVDTRSKRPTVLVAVTLIHVQLCLVQPTCRLCCFLQDLTSLVDCDFSLDDVMNVPTYSNHTSCSLSTREDFFQGESLLSCALWNHNLVFSNIYNDALVFYRELTINNGYIQLVQVKKSIRVVRRFMFHGGNRMLFVIMERMFSFVRPLWDSLALGSVYPTIHLLPFASSLHELRHGVFTKEFDIVFLELIAAGSQQMDVAESSTLVHVHSPIFQVALHENSSLCAFMSAFMLLCDCFHVNDVSGLIPHGLLVFGVSPDFTRDSVQAMEFVGSFSHIHDHLLDHLKGSYHRYKAAADYRRRELQFYVGAYVWALITKEFSVSGSYDHLETGTIDPLEVRGKIYTWEILEKVNATAYKVLFPSDARCSDVFNVTLLYPCISIADTEDSRANLFLPRVT